MDLLIVCMEAGLSLQATINRVADEVRPISVDLHNELTLLNAELRTGISRETALKNMAERTGVQNVNSLVGMMIQSDRMGTSISQALRVHSAFLRTQRAQKAEEQAAKLPVKIMFPMLMFIFPAVFIVVLGPAVIHIMQSGFFKNSWQLIGRAGDLRYSREGRRLELVAPRERPGLRVSIFRPQWPDCRLGRNFLILSLISDNQPKSRQYLRSRIVTLIYRQAL